MADRNQKLEEAVRLGQEHLSLMRGAFSSRSSQFDAMLKDVVALLAYVNPEVGLSSNLSGCSLHLPCLTTSHSILQGIFRKTSALQGT